MKTAPLTVDLHLHFDADCLHCRLWRTISDHCGGVAPTWAVRDALTSVLAQLIATCADPSQHPPLIEYVRAEIVTETARFHAETASPPRSAMS